MGQIKIISDGTTFGTKIIDKETGNEIKNCTALTVEATPHKITAVLTLMDVELDIVCDSEIKK